MARTAVFDLDGTITRGDTLLPFLLCFLAYRPARLLRVVLSLVSCVLAVLWRRMDGNAARDFIKERLIVACVRGARKEEVERHVAGLVDRIVRNGLRRDALAVIEQHRQRGDRLVLLSASPDVYVAALAERLRFDQWISTELLWEGEVLQGSFKSPNRRGEAKAGVVRALRAANGERIVAYANSTSDIAHLQLAEEALLVNGSTRARERARRVGLPVATWQ